MKWRLTAVVAAALATGSALAGWLLIPSDPAQVRLWSMKDCFGLVCIFIVCPTVLGLGCWLLAQRAPRLERGAGLVALVAVASLAPLAQRYTEVGVFLLGGGSYWVERAAGEPTDAVAADYLNIVLQATQYGLNVAENAVGALPDRGQQARLFTLLAAVTHNESWAVRFRERARQAASVQWRQGE